MIAQIQNRLNKYLNEYNFVVKTVEDETVRLVTEKSKTANIEEALKVLQGIAAEVQNNAHKHIASVVTKCLSIVFSDPYTFNIIFEKKRNKTEARLVFMLGENELDPAEECGGGLLDVASFALRLSSILLQQPQMRRVMITDEPFRHLSKDHSEQVKEMLLMLAKEMKFQFIMITHEPKLQCGKVVRLGENNDD